MNTQQQFEINVKSPRANRISRRQLRLVRARWWFEQMRRAVEQAEDHVPNQVRMPQQHPLPLDRVA